MAFNFQCKQDGDTMNSPQTIAVTTGPKQHFFGYYDKFSDNRSGRYVLCHEVAFNDRPPTGEDAARIGLIDLEAGNGFGPLAETRAWCWQQGSMLQWHPAEPEHTIIHNDRRDGQFVCVIRDIASGKERVLPRPVAAVSRDGKKALSLNFARLADERPGYGYAGVPDPWAKAEAPDDDGLYLMDMETGDYKLIISLAQIVAFAPQPTMAGVKHWFNHLLFSPDDRRFIFLHRWRHGTGRLTRLFTADIDGGSICCVNDHDMSSHFDWRDPEHLIVFANRHEIGLRYFLFTDRTDRLDVIGDEKLTSLGDGHCSYSPDRRWILTDTYPNAQKERKLLLYHPGKDVRADVGDYYSVPWMTECRCDLHPRWTRDGRRLTFDSSHTGSRQVYLMDVGRIVDSAD